MNTTPYSSLVQNSVQTSSFKRPFAQDNTLKLEPREFGDTSRPGEFACKDLLALCFLRSPARFSPRSSVRTAPLARCEGFKSKREMSMRLREYSVPWFGRTARTAEHEHDYIEILIFATSPPLNMKQVPNKTSNIIKPIRWLNQISGVRNWFHRLPAPGQGHLPRAAPGGPGSPETVSGTVPSSHYFQKIHSPN